MTYTVEYSNSMLHRLELPQFSSRQWNNTASFPPSTCPTPAGSSGFVSTFSLHEDQLAQAACLTLEKQWGWILQGCKLQYGIFRTVLETTDISTSMLQLLRIQRDIQNTVCTGLLFWPLCHILCYLCLLFCRTLRRGENINGSVRFRKALDWQQEGVCFDRDFIMGKGELIRVVKQCTCLFMIKSLIPQWDQMLKCDWSEGVHCFHLPKGLYLPQ